MKNFSFFHSVKPNLPDHLLNNHYETWTNDQLCLWLKSIKLEMYVQEFMEQEIDGSHLKDLDRAMLQDLVGLGLKIFRARNSHRYMSF